MDNNTDCIKSNGKSCYCLKDKICIGCNFYTTAEQAEKKLILHDQRLNRLSPIRQQQIADMYYSGQRVWAR